MLDLDVFPHCSFISFGSVPVENKQYMLDTSITLLWSAISSVGFLPVDTWRLGYLGVIGLYPRGVTYRRDSEAQVIKISKKVKFGD